MKNLQKYLMILGTIMLSIGISACSKQPDFDAKSYVQSSLDAYYHGEYKDYANLLELSEKDAKKEIEEDFNESIQKQFDDSDNITDKGIADYTEKLTEVKKLYKLHPLLSHPVLCILPSKAGKFVDFFVK